MNKNLTQISQQLSGIWKQLGLNQRISIIKEAQKIFYADMPSLWVERRYSWTFTAPNIQDFQYANDGLPLIDRLWIKSH